MMEDDKKISEYITNRLNHSVDQLDETVLLRLRQARQSAVASMPQESLTILNGIRAINNSATWWTTATAGVVVATIVLVLVQNTPDSRIPKNPTNVLELFAAEDSFELYENLTFYQWLSEKEIHHGG